MTHLYIAKDIYNKLDKRVKENVKLDELLVFSKGFDVFFFGFKNIIKESNKVNCGIYFHKNKVNEYLINVTNKVKKSKNIDEFMYLIGLITHYISDSRFHPYINYKSFLLEDLPITRNDCHFMIESYFDNYLINKRENGDYKKFKMYEKGYFDLEKKDNLIKLLDNSFKEVFELSNMGNNYYKGLKIMKSFFKYFRYDKFGIKKGFYLSVNFLAKRLFRDVSYLSCHFNLNKDLEFLNLQHDEWYNIDNIKIKSKDSMLDLYNLVIKEGKDIIEKVYDYIFLDKKIDLNKLYGNKSYSNGLVLE